MAKAVQPLEEAARAGPDANDCLCSTPNAVMAVKHIHITSCSLMVLL